jgi:hydrogenase maturation protease
MRTLIVGLGNLLLQDDGIGIYITEQLENSSKSNYTDFIICDTDILKLMTRYKDQERIIIIDAVNSDLPPGSVITLREKGLFSFNAFARSAHQMSVLEALKLMKITVPGFEQTEMFFIGLQVEDTILNREISQTVMESAGVVIKLVNEIMEDWYSARNRT